MEMDKVKLWYCCLCGTGHIYHLCESCIQVECGHIYCPACVIIKVPGNESINQPDQLAMPTKDKPEEKTGDENVPATVALGEPSVARFSSRLMFSLRCANC
jgi:hypothetical protein